MPQSMEDDSALIFEEETKSPSDHLFMLKKLETIQEEEESRASSLCYLKNSLALEPQILDQTGDKIIVYRGNHYCQNHAFVNNFIKLFQNSYPPFLEHPLVHNQEVLDAELALEFQKSFVEEVAKANVDAILDKMKESEN